MQLRELEIGDIFRHAKSKAKYPQKFVVMGNCVFNRGHGSSTRMCRTLCGEQVSKSCNLEVVKTGESIHKSKMKSCIQPK